MKSRRRIASPMGLGVRRLSLTACDYSSDLGLAEWGLTLHFACQQSVGPNVRFESKADMCVAKRHVRFTPNSDRKSRHLPKVMSALPPKADMCSAIADVRFGPKADSCSAAKGIVIRSPRRLWQAGMAEWLGRAPSRF